MRGFWRTAAVRATAVWLAAAYLKLVYLTLRWTREEEERAVSLWDGGAGVIVCFWHACIPISPPCWDRKRGAQEPRALVSNSADGDLIAEVAGQVGFPAIRGSRQRAGSVGDKGGDRAYRDMIRWVAGGGGVAITPDGPVGPAEVMGMGAPSLARLTGAPVLLVGFACKPCWRLKTWDRTIIPRPFARAALVWDGPFEVKRGDDLAEIAADWSRRLSAATERAEALTQ